MKKIKSCITFFCLVLFSTSILAQKSALPEKILKTFSKKYPQVEAANWEVKSKGDYKIKFEFEGKKTVVEIDEDGSWEKTTTHLLFSGLPEAIQAKVNAQKKKSEISEIKMVIDADGKTIYKVDLTDEAKTIKLDFNKRGEIIKSEIKKSK